MTRENTQTNQLVCIKQHKNSNICWFIVYLALVSTCLIAYFTLPQQSIDRFTHIFTVTSIPVSYKYNCPEGISPEDRDVFEGFQTSFLPSEEVMMTRAEPEPKHRRRRKRMSDYSLEDVPCDRKHRNIDVNNNGEAESVEDDDVDCKPSTEDETSESYEDEYDDEDDDDSPAPQELHVDRGPLDDVVDQIRGQPELEEGETGSSAQVFKPSRSYTVLHSFWKGQGDRETIRSTQANIMSKYMDAGANPCEDFYQYACGNWASLNPIPADKAGYDTFEMLRENLDAVLKDLLDFPKNETVPSEYPGKSLNLDDEYLQHHLPVTKQKKLVEQFLSKKRKDSVQELLKTTFNPQLSAFSLKANKTKTIDRMRRFLRRPTRNKIGAGKQYKITLNHIPQEINKLKKYNKRDSNHFRSKKYFHNKKSPMSPKLIKIGRRLLGLSKEIETQPNRLYNQIHFQTMPQKKLSDSSGGDAALKAKYLFKSCMNYDILKERGHQPLLDLLNLLGGWPILDPNWNSTDFDWLELMAKLRLFNNDILISEWVGPDIKNSNEFVIQFDQTSLGLPTRDYFLQDINKPYLDAYQTYLETVAILLGGEETHVKSSADSLILFEMRLALITSAPEDRRNVSELYRRMSLSELTTLVPEVDWSRYLCIVMNRTVHPEEPVVLFALPYVRNLVSLIKETNPEVLSNYLLWRFVRHRVNNLDDRFQSAKQAFYFILFGREQAPPRWKNCISQVNSNMGMALGSMFVRKYFDEMSKNDTLTMTREIQESFRELLDMTDWIDNDTKKLAAEKVDAMMLRIGYPDFILNKKELDDRYKEVIIHPDKYFENILNILQHLTKMEQTRIGQPVNKTLWNTAPAVVNAYYSRNKNQIMFPAGILQPPFYHRHFPRSLNYGGIGVVIGHEITHGFDDKGRLFDHEGNLHRWWSDAAVAQFRRRAQGLARQYARYVVPEVHMQLDGVNTQGENIADNGGVKQAFRAYLRWLERHGAEGETLPGVNHTHTQLFFLNFAQVWCGAMRPEAMRNKLKTAVHSPGRFRVIGTLSNSYDFAREFNCPVGSPMNPEEKNSVW
ncbi:neprilysin-4 [Plutella xylostella]|uniref:neprilysin-4 n=1 Tax=Plutella xylostella TaxID=51655 RepID=UPI0020331BD0|nr:neprilysin-4 [Plutella xylostella]